MSRHYDDRRPPPRDSHGIPRRPDRPARPVPENLMAPGVPADYDRSWDAYYAAPEWRGGDDPRKHRDERDRERVRPEQGRQRDERDPLDPRDPRDARDPRLVDSWDRDGRPPASHREREERNGGGIVAERLPPSQKFKPQVPINPNPVVPDTGLPTPGLTAQFTTSATNGAPPANSSSTPQPNSAPQPQATDNKDQSSLDSLAKLRQFKAEVEATRHVAREGPSELEPSRLAKMAESFLLSQRQNQNETPSLSDDEKRAREQKLREQLKARTKSDDAVASPAPAGGATPNAPAGAVKEEAPEPAADKAPTQIGNGNGNGAARPVENKQRPRAEDLIDSPTTARPATAKPTTPTAAPSAPQPPATAQPPSAQPPSGPAQPPTGPALHRQGRGRSPAPHPPQESRDLASRLAPRGRRPASPPPANGRRQSSLERGQASTWRPGQDDERSRSRERPPRAVVNPRDRSMERERRNREMQEERRALGLDKDGSRSPRARPPPRGPPLNEGRKLADRISGPRISGPPPPRGRPRSPSPIRPPPNHRGPRGPSPPPRLAGPRDAYNAPPSPPPARHYSDPRSAPPGLYGRPYDARGPPDSRDAYDYRGRDTRDRAPPPPLDSRDAYRQPPSAMYDRAPREYDRERERGGRYGAGDRADPYIRSPPPDYRRDSRDGPRDLRDPRDRDVRDSRDVRDVRDSRDPRDVAPRGPTPANDNVVETLEALKAQIAHLEKMVPSSGPPEREPPPAPRAYPTGSAYNHPTAYAGRYDSRGSPPPRDGPVPRLASPPPRPRSPLRGYDPRDRDYEYERERALRERERERDLELDMGPRKRRADAELDDLDDMGPRGPRSRARRGRGGSLRGRG
ncbi:hypothetical protein IAT38_001374 [Cryptococcus sp. DSM 104549]